MYGDGSKQWYCEYMYMYFFVIDVLLKIQFFSRAQVYNGDIQLLFCRPAFAH